MILYLVIGLAWGGYRYFDPFTKKQITEQLEEEMPIQTAEMFAEELETKKFLIAIMQGIFWPVNMFMQVRSWLTKGESE